MFVKSVMIPKEKCLTVDMNTTVQEVLHQLESKEIDALPVLENGMYKGMFNRYLLYKAFFNSGLDKATFLGKTSVSDILVRESTYILINDVFEKAFIKLSDFPIIAVVEEGKFLGIVTRYDTMDQFKSAFGMNSKGTRITFASVEIEGQILKVSDILHKYRTSVISLVTFDESDKLVRRIVLKIDNELKLERIVAELDKAGFRVLHIDKDL